MSIQVVKCQTRVKTVIGDIKAIITGICIREGSISYELSYFQNGEKKEAWLNRFEFEIDTKTPKKAGLVDYDITPNQDGYVTLLEE